MENHHAIHGKIHYFYGHFHGKIHYKWPFFHHFSWENPLLPRSWFPGGHGSMPPGMPCAAVTGRLCGDERQDGMG